jgi:hypothetical protein
VNEFDVFNKWDSGCRGKVRYSKAKHAVGRIQRICRSACGVNVSSLAYRCEFCGGFHFEHQRRAFAARIEEGGGSGRIGTIKS